MLSAWVRGQNRMLKRLNLVPQIPLAEKIKKKTPVILGVFLAVIGVFLFSRIQYLNYQIKKNDSAIESMLQRVAESEKLQKRVSSLNSENISTKKEYTEILNQVSGLDSMSLEKISYSKILNSISSSLPQTVKCSRMSFTEKSGVIHGSALRYKDLPLLVRTLKKDPLFQHIELQDLDRVEGNTPEPFTFDIAFNLR